MFVLFTALFVPCGDGGGGCSNINKRLRAKIEQAISSLSYVATIKTSLMIHNHVIFYFTLSKDGTLSKSPYYLASFTSGDSSGPQ